MLWDRYEEVQKYKNTKYKTCKINTLENEPANGECGEGCEVEEAVTVVSSLRILKLRRDIFYE